MGGNIQAPFYRVIPVSLDSDGTHTLNGEMGLIHLVRAETAAGALALDALVNIRLGDVNNDDIPLSVNGQIDASGFSKAIFSWSAQPGVTAYFALSRSSERFRVEAPPAKQLVTSAIATGASYDRQTIDTTASAVAAANGTRHSIGLMADAANSGVIYVASDASVTTSTGWPLEAGEKIVFQHSARIDAIASASGQALHVIEEDS